MSLGCKAAVNHYAAREGFDPLVKNGFLKDAGVVASVFCGDCEQPHEAQTCYIDDKYGYYCPDTGFVPLVRAQIAAIEPDLAKLVASLADVLNCKKRKTTPLHGETWRIGVIETHGGDLSIYFHPRLQDEIDIRAVSSALARDVKTAFGLILSARGAAPVEKFSVSTLDEVVDLDETASKLVLLCDLSTLVGAPHVAKGGRPSLFATPMKSLILDRQTSGQALRGRNAEAKAALAEFIAIYPHEIAPSLSTVKRYISNT